MVVLEHIQDSLPQQLQILFREAGGLAGKIGRNITLGTVQAVGHDMLVAHFTVLLFSVCLGGDGYAGNGHLLRHDRVNRAGKAQLHRPVHLAAVQRTLDKGGHHGTEGADIVEMFAHIIPQLAVDIRVAFLGLFQVVLGGQTVVLQRLGIAAVQGYALLDIDAVIVGIGGVLLQRLHIVADLALQADIGHQTVAGLGVDAGHITGIRVTVGVAVLYIEQNDEIVAVLDRYRHFFIPPRSF